MPFIKTSNQETEQALFSQPQAQQG